MVICKNCKFMNLKELPGMATCNKNPKMDFVTGEYEKQFCSIKNYYGKCEDYEPKEPKASQK